MGACRRYDCTNTSTGCDSFCRFADNSILYVQQPLKKARIPPSDREGVHPALLRNLPHHVSSRQGGIEAI